MWWGYNWHPTLLIGSRVVHKKTLVDEVWRIFSLDIFDQKNRKTVLKKREMYKKVRISIRSTKKFEKLRAIRNLVMIPIMLQIVRLKMNLLLTNLETSLMIMSLKMPLQPRQKNCWAVQSKSCFLVQNFWEGPYFWSGRSHCYFTRLNLKNMGSL